MPKLPVVSGPEIIRALKRAGFYIHDQSGSHVIMKHRGTGARASVPSHGGQDLPSGTVRGIIAGAGLAVEEFRRLLK